MALWGEVSANGQLLLTELGFPLGDIRLFDYGLLASIHLTKNCALRAALGSSERSQRKTTAHRAAASRDGLLRYTDVIRLRATFIDMGAPLLPFGGELA